MEPHLKGNLREKPSRLEQVRSPHLLCRHLPRDREADHSGWKAFTPGPSMDRAVHHLNVLCRGIPYPGDYKEEGSFPSIPKVPRLKGSGGTGQAFLSSSNVVSCVKLCLSGRSCAKTQSTPSRPLS